MKTIELHELHTDKKITLDTKNIKSLRVHMDSDPVLGLIKSTIINTGDQSIHVKEDYDTILSQINVTKNN